MSSRHYCPECDQRLGDHTWWCESCQRRHFVENFDNWSTGDKSIDDFIKQTQMNAKECDQYLEWIPFSAFINVNKSEISEVGTLFTANWIKGPNDTWDPVEGEYVARRGLLKVALTSLGGSPSLFLKELKMHYHSRMFNGLVMRLFGVTRESVTSNLMMVAETVEWDVRHYVSHHHTRLTWQNKLAILHTIVSALEIVKSEKSTQHTIKSHIEISVNELGLGLNPNPAGRMVAPPKIHPQAIYTSRLLKFPALPIPRNSPIPIPRRSQSHSDHDYGRTQMSNQDLAAILIRDESFFSTGLLMQRRSVYPEEEPESEDEDIIKQYELSIPSNYSSLDNYGSTSSSKNIEPPSKSLSILTDNMTDEPEISEELMRTPITSCFSPTTFKHS
ncbi:3578_t:CDS:2 [Funneliformis mosseae]|uniref:3578_t:CDS:1 n=1 Tax=Funneliformis mosseae TaxID=27381 RepID=A0A9N8VYA9_FUNMO|nr:3578_t:CDS:2 [Funneliformis mosseae]